MGEAVSSAGVATRHEAVIPSLRPGARYTYRVYSARGLLAGAAGTVDFSFRAPEPDVLRLVVFGDSGLGSPGQYAVAKAIGAEAVAPDLVMIVGDVIYPPADDASYDPRFFAPYRTLLPAVPVLRRPRATTTTRSRPASPSSTSSPCRGTAPPASRPSRPTGSSGRACR